MKIYATLMCKECQQATLHIFAERRTIRVVPGETTYVNLMYECDGCGVVRTWGNEPRNPTPRQVERESDAFDHAVRAHGMRRTNCPACRGMGLDCQECSDRGWTWGFDKIGPCGPRCPIGADDGADSSDDVEDFNCPSPPESGDSGDDGNDERQPAARTVESGGACQRERRDRAETFSGIGTRKRWL